MTDTSSLRVDGVRLTTRLEELSRVGRQPDGGITRLALTSVEREAHALFERWARQSGLGVSTDTAGNLFCQLDGQDASLAPLFLGSHLDTVPEGGAFDGALGCVAALEVVTAIAEAGLRPRRSIAAVVWTDEEGARFGSGFFGSRSFAGNHSSQDLDLVDGGGTTLGAALMEVGLDPNLVGQDPPPMVHAYLELHIEQGPILEELDLPVGIVTAIVGMIHLRVELVGSAGHAGTTPMSRRADALTASAEIVLGVEAAAREAGPQTVATVGQLMVQPGASNVIPGACSFSIDIRDQDEAVLARAYELIQATIERVAVGRGVEATVQEILRLPPVSLSSTMQDVLARACERQGIPAYCLPSGAGHDAMILAGATDAGMLFTRCHGGISHHPAESIIPEDGVIGMQVLLDAAVELTW